MTTTQSPDAATRYPEAAIVVIVPSTVPNTSMRPGRASPARARSPALSRAR